MIVLSAAPDIRTILDSPVARVALYILDPVRVQWDYSPAKRWCGFSVETDSLNDLLLGWLITRGVIIGAELPSRVVNGVPEGNMILHVKSAGIFWAMGRVKSAEEIRIISYYGDYCAFTICDNHSGDGDGFITSTKTMDEIAIRYLTECNILEPLCT